MDSIGGFTSALGEAFRDLLHTIFGALSGFVGRISLFTSNIYYYIPRPYVIGGLTILVLGILLMLAVGRPRR
jgi:hypothetical protein